MQRKNGTLLLCDIAEARDGMMRATFCRAGQDLVSGSEPRMRGESGFLGARQTEVKSGWNSAAPQHPFGRHGLRKTDEFDCKIVADGVKNPPNTNGGV